MPLSLILILILAGLVLVLLEVLVIPGTTVVGIAGLGIIAFAIYEGYAALGSVTGHFILLGTIIISVLSLYFALKSNTWNRIKLKASIDGKVNVVEQGKVNVGDEGQSVSRISPSGKAFINDEFFEVHTNGEFIDQETGVVVTQLMDNKIFVKRKI